ncbi:protein neprosin-like [Magnolia sinica]|uniref:protein neprosin-like n=1 Tax=Magnolia sinica TaxID=86752 RepID=UPI002659D965|nr:protein neprosin-like [Magnolia sinica]
MQEEVYGAQVDMNLWKPKLADNWQFSLAQLWIVNGNRETRNTIEVGWHVFPFLYINTEPRTLAYWTADGYNNTGCYNLDCVGLVLVHSTNTLIGKPLAPFSQYNGDQHDITIKVQK